MKLAGISTALLTLGCISGGVAIPTALDLTSAEISPRAFSNAPDGYTPANVSCPANRPTIRSASSLSTNETAWIDVRRQQTVSAMKDFFGHINMSSFDAVSYINNHASNITNIPNIGIAVSGGGYRALTNGAGAIKAFDSRTEHSTQTGHLGGLLQSATYLSGLSGGGWLLGSIYINNFSTISNLQTYKEGEVWQFQNSITKGPKTNGLQAWDTAQYYYDLAKVVAGKKDAGFNISFTDYWGRALSYQLINATDGGPSYTWSSIALTQDFKDGKMPMPLLVADGRNPGETLIGSNSTVYEFNPWEFGSFDPSIYGFAPLEYLGSHFSNGEIPSSRSCVRGFDNAGFVMGTSSSLFNQFILKLNTTDIPSTLKKILANILEELGDRNDDIAIYSPNPFYGYRNATVEYAQTPDLNVVDGGEDKQNLPLHPLIQPTRNVDVIFAVDSSASTSNNWPNGSPLVATYERSLNSSGIANGTAFPSIPDKNTFINLGLNTHPTFFGCNSSNITTGHAPLVVYLPNYPYTTYSNKSTFQLKYDISERDDMITNGYNVVTMANSTRDSSSSDWPTCAACAILSRSFDRTNTQVPAVCSQCFEKYCWDGTRNSTTPAAYEPAILMASAKSAGLKNMAVPGVFSLLVPFVVLGVWFG
ncbi:lysophospholipase Plb1 [Aspergillus sclerotiicarbonarius CBS 121057]|uniref:Lysophospholipase n=1 Tax=Aspergillus sclerotiicarbonarius (strain CBS 121057 / IBT 28362) TaxID=1448318 RepID=A0A319DWX4_ASPSB|nr:lysophospholipase Plb1 [Aspergillus sclerotiicarbonarius CBS 121057]